MPGEKLNILLIGGGAREHALAWRLARSERCEALYTTHPENPGLAALARPMGFEFNAREAYRIQQFCKAQEVGLVVIGPEDPLAAGLVDKLDSGDGSGPAVFGPVQDAARLEADKAWAKGLMRSASIPMAEGRSFREHEAALSYVRSRESAQVVKASGLARGKGAIVCDSLQEAEEALERIMVRREFGAAGDEIVIEERLKGREASVLALVDGRTIWVLEACQDHKRLGEGDTGPNTGGMGAFCPTDAVDEALMARVEREILVPTVDALKREGIEFRGVLYAGLMLTPGGPKTLEFNVRFGDPECQPLMMRWRGDLADALVKCARGRLREARIEWDQRAACCVVLASRGYPEKPETGFVIEGVEEAERMEDVAVFHAGTKRTDAGELVTAGGRVLGVTALGETVSDARERALEACDVIQFEGKRLRRDIGGN